jgi:hypothetical protein
VAASPRTATPGFTDAVRAYVGVVLGSLYRSMPAAVAEEALNFGGDAAGMAAWVAKTQPGWALEGGVITVQRTERNDPNPAAAAAAETIPLTKLAALMA